MSYAEYKSYLSGARGKIKIMERQEGSRFQTLPKDVVSLIVQFLTHAQRLRLACVSRGLKNLLHSGDWGVELSFAEVCSRRDVPALSSFYASERDSLVKAYWIRKISTGIYGYVTSLSFSTCFVTPEEINQILTSCPAVVLLDLSYTAFDDAGLSRLRLGGISHLKLNHCASPSLQMRNPELLCALSKLKSLSIAHCVQISQESIIGLVEKCFSLTSLDLSGCSVGDHSLGVVRETLLETLWLNETRFNDSTFQEFLCMCPALTSLHVSRCRFLSDRGVCSVIRETFREFSFAGNIGEECFVKVSTLPSIQWIDASYSSIKATKIVQILSIPSLSRLEISGCKEARLDSLRSGEFMRILIDHSSRLTTNSKRYFALRGPCPKTMRGAAIM